jgi:hypothetical protein
VHPKRTLQKKVPKFQELFFIRCILLSTDEGLIVNLPATQRAFRRVRPAADRLWRRRDRNGDVFPQQRARLKDNRQQSEKLMTTGKNEELDGHRAELRASDIIDPNSQIGVRLRSLYAAAQEEAIPDRFLDLLEKLDQAEMASVKAAK